MNAGTEKEEKQFNTMLKDQKSYRTVKGPDGIWAIPTKHGDIEPFSFTELCCYQDMGTKRKKGFFKLKLPSYCTIFQEGDTDLVFRFPRARLDAIPDLVHAQKKRMLSVERREELRRHALTMARQRQAA